MSNITFQGYSVVDESREMTVKEARDTALRLLGRREHSCKELEQKLKQRGAPDQAIQEVLAYLLDNNYLSNARYAEMIINRRLSQGYGPRKIAFELAQKGIDRQGSETLLYQSEIDWSEVAREIIYKKFNGSGKTAGQVQKQQRFLQQRGFEFEHIRKAMQD